MMHIWLVSWCNVMVKSFGYVNRFLCMCVLGGVLPFNWYAVCSTKFSSEFFEKDWCSKQFVSNLNSNPPPKPFLSTFYHFFPIFFFTYFSLPLNPQLKSWLSWFCTFLWCVFSFFCLFCKTGMIHGRLCNRMTNNFKSYIHQTLIQDMSKIVD